MVCRRKAAGVAAFSNATIRSKFVLDALFDPATKACSWESGTDPYN